jgi:hypothetical protein
MPLWLALGPMSGVAEWRGVLARRRLDASPGFTPKEADVAQEAAPHRILDDGGWKPFAVSATVTLLVAGVHAGVIDALMLAVMRVQHLGG